jgi:hypothetical protein
MMATATPTTRATISTRDRKPARKRTRPNIPRALAATICLLVAVLPAPRTSRTSSPVTLSFRQLHLQLDNYILVLSNHFGVYFLNSDRDDPHMVT